MYRGRSARDNKGLLPVAVLHVRKRGRDSTRHYAQPRYIFALREHIFRIKNYIVEINIILNNSKHEQIYQNMMENNKSLK